ncbi:hypothetical protein F5B19DRAFT_449624 [Rostrohypoxylon terebratum]|nr:hypothetical protein F5B19DRAFT_449624 [Rostrohypoxylon terebratum]
MTTNHQILPANNRLFFHQFSKMPGELQLEVWENATPEPKAGFILLSDSVKILQAPPAMAHACKTSRDVVLKSGGMYELSDGDMTWFHAETDFLLWGGGTLGLGELAPAIRNIVIPRRILNAYFMACETFERLLADSELTGIQNIYVNLEEEFTFVGKQWNPQIGSELFNSESNTVVVPDLNIYNDSMDRIDRVVPMLPQRLADHWQQHKGITFNDDEEHWWVVLGGEIMHAYLSTIARLCEEITEEQYDEFEAGTLMHPSGEISWWDFLFEKAPYILPTQIFARTTEREKVEGHIENGDDPMPSKL